MTSLWSKFVWIMKAVSINGVNINSPSYIHFDKMLIYISLILEHNDRQSDVLINSLAYRYTIHATTLNRHYTCGWKNLRKTQEWLTLSIFVKRSPYLYVLDFLLVCTKTRSISAASVVDLVNVYWYILPKICLRCSLCSDYPYYSVWVCMLTTDPSCLS